MLAIEHLERVVGGGLRLCADCSHGAVVCARALVQGTALAILFPDQAVRA